jgi:UrcA family protein
MSRFWLIGLAGAALLPAPAAADYRWLRGGEEVTASATVSHADLDLTRADHVRLLEARVRRAAVRLCTSDAAQPIKIPLETRRCVRQATRAATVQIAKARSSEARRFALRKE